MQLLPGPAEWQPVLARELGGEQSFEAFRCEQELEVFRSELERRALQLGLQPLRWPEPFPFDSELRDAGGDLRQEHRPTVRVSPGCVQPGICRRPRARERRLRADRRRGCEIHPTALKKTPGLRSVGAELHARTSRARSLGVSDVPAVLVGEEVFVGERGLEDAARRMGEHGRTGGLLR